MDKFRKQLKRQRSCQHCIRLSECLTGYCKQKSQLTNQIIEEQVSLYQLKETVRDLKIECMGPHSGLKEKSRMWQRPYSHFSASLDENYEIPKSSSLPLVRPRKIRQKCDSARDVPTITEGCVELKEPATPEEQDGYDIPKVNISCCLCKKLEEQIKQDIADLRSLQNRLLEKQDEVEGHKRAVQSLQKQVTKHSRSSQFQTPSGALSLPPDPVRYPLNSLNSWRWSEGNDSGHVSVLDCDTFLTERDSSVSDLFEEYRAIREDMKLLQERQDSVVRIICSRMELLLPQ